MSPDQLIELPCHTSIGDTEYRVTLIVRVAPTRVLELVNITEFRRIDNGPLTMKERRDLIESTDMLTAGVSAALLGVEPETLWREHLENVVPRMDGETKAAWVSRLWHGWAMPYGMTLQDLADGLGLSRETVRQYAYSQGPK